MARGYDKHQERLSALNALGRALARRSGSRCELCGTSGETLTFHEVDPVPDDPDLDHTLFLCSTCRAGLLDQGRVDPNHWHCLREAIWSETRAAQVVAVRKLRRIASDPLATWAEEALESLYLDPEVEAWIDQVPS